MNCKITGYDYKGLEVELNPSERFFCEKGALVYHEAGIEKDVRVMDKGLSGLLKRRFRALIISKGLHFVFDSIVRQYCRMRFLTLLGLVFSKFYVYKSTHLSQNLYILCLSSVNIP
jgi:hypothetical protein